MWRVFAWLDFVWGERILSEVDMMMALRLACYHWVSSFRFVASVIARRKRRYSVLEIELKIIVITCLALCSALDSLSRL